MKNPGLGIVIVSYNSGDVLLDCLESLLAVVGPEVRIVVVENDSTDDTAEVIQNWAAGTPPYQVPDDCPFPLTATPKPVPLHVTDISQKPETTAQLVMLDAGVNGGYAGGVNAGLAYLAADPAIENFWILNPDSMVPPETLGTLQNWLAQGPRYGLLGGRVNYLENPDQVQIDGGTLNYKTGVTGNVNLGHPAATSTPPKASDLDFITGASMVASRAFYDRVGGMKDDYFLYYEEVDWAMRRGDLPLAYCEGFLIYHRAGTSIGSPTLARFASPFSLYFKHRNRMRFLRRFKPASLITGYAYSIAKVAQILLRGYLPEAGAVFRAVHALPPPKAVRERLSPEAARLAFGKSTGV